MRDWEARQRRRWVAAGFNWRVALVRVVANGLSITVVVLVIPGVDADTDRVVLSILWVGLVYGALNALIRPLLNLLLVPFALQTYGLAMAAINVVLFLLLAYVSTLITIDSVWAAIGGGVLLSFVAWLLEGLLGLSRPVLGDERDEATA